MTLLQVGSDGPIATWTFQPHHDEKLVATGLWLSIITLRQGQSLDLATQERVVHDTEAGDSRITLFLSNVINELDTEAEEVSLGLLHSRRAGYLIRNDFLERRLQCCEHIQKAQTFHAPLGSVRAEDVQPPSLSQQYLSSAVGGLWLESAADKLDQISKLSDELVNRLSIPWLSIEPIARRRIAWAQGRENFKSIRRAFESAQALGIDLVILDAPGHWLEDDEGEHAYLREAFVPCSVEVDDGFTQRLVDCVRAYPHKIDGLMTISDVRLAPVARACEILGLPTEPPAAYDIAGDKARTRLLEPEEDNVITLQDTDDLQEYLKRTGEEALRFPLIVKPTLGWNSDCVAKVRDLGELKQAVERASIRHAHEAKHSTGVIIEPYIDGPEVDANFALLNGEILFFDINDDFPSRGDADNANHESNFQETQNVFNTALPSNEVQALRDYLHQAILRHGFRSGIFHCEARVRNSRVEYRRGSDGIVDLRLKEQIPSGDIGVYLIENNPRTPGYLETVAVDLTYGVDYYALRMLLAVGDSETTRLRALSIPYANGAQFHLSAMIVPQTRTGTMKTADAGADFMRKHQDLAKQIPDYKTQILGGEEVGGPTASSLWWLAYFSVFSRRSRHDCLELVKFIEDNYEYELE